MLMIIFINMVIVVMIMIINMVIRHHQIIWLKMDDPGRHMQVMVSIVINGSECPRNINVVNMGMVIIESSWSPSS